MPKVLVYVDDSDDDLFLFQAACRIARVRFALVPLRGGQEALRYFDRAGHYADRTEFPEPDAILLDIKMPEVDGFAVLRHLRGVETLATVPVGMLTASDWPGDVQAAKELGATWFFLKPPEMKAMIELAGQMDGYLHDDVSATDAMVRASKFDV